MSEEINLRVASYIVCKETHPRGPYIVSEEIDPRGLSHSKRRN